jgi:hypothetical protein
MGLPFLVITRPADLMVRACAARAGGVERGAWGKRAVSAAAARRCGTPCEWHLLPGCRHETKILSFTEWNRYGARTAAVRCVVYKCSG